MTQSELWRTDMSKYCDSDKCVIPVEWNKNDLVIEMTIPNSDLKEFVQAIMTTLMKEMTVRGHVLKWRYV